MVSKAERGQDLESRMRNLEWFHGLTIPPGAFTIIRVDGRNFHTFTKNLEKPFDPAFNSWMLTTAATLIQELQGIYAYVQSDEISVLLPRKWDMFSRELEKLVSVSAGIASSAFSITCRMLAHFDSRAIPVSMDQDVIDYFLWRYNDAARNAIQAACYWQLRKSGLSDRAATGKMLHKGFAELNELLFQQGINFNDLPALYKRGAGIYWTQIDKQGFNPLTQETVMVKRNRLYIDRYLASSEYYALMIDQIMDDEKISRPPTDRELLTYKNEVQPCET